MTTTAIKPSAAATRMTPQVVLVLDDSANVLNVNSALAGSSLSFFSEDGRDLHSQLHGDCPRDCEFSRQWKKAWGIIASRDSVEWELYDDVLGRMLRFNLSRPPTSLGVVKERRQRHALLTITDITKHRQEYDALLRREAKLQLLLRAKGIDPDTALPGVSSETTNYESGFRTQSQHVILAQEYERKRIASELHDSVAQSLAVIKYRIESEIECLANGESKFPVSGLEETVEQVKSLMDEVRRISTNLAPANLDEFGLCVALQWLCDEFRSGERELSPGCAACVDESEISDIIKISVYRIVQEALSNVARHSTATEVKVDVSMDKDELVVVIEDNGEGFDPASSPRSAGAVSGFGLNNMRERALTSGGAFSLASLPGEGVRIEARWSVVACN